MTSSDFLQEGFSSFWISILLLFFSFFLLEFSQKKNEERGSHPDSRYHGDAGAPEWVCPRGGLWDSGWRGTTRQYRSWCLSSHWNQALDCKKTAYPTLILHPWSPLKAPGGPWRPWMPWKPLNAPESPWMFLMWKSGDFFNS